MKKSRYQVRKTVFFANDPYMGRSSVNGLSSGEPVENTASRLRQQKLDVSAAVAFDCHSNHAEIVVDFEVINGVLTL